MHTQRVYCQGRKIMQENLSLYHVFYTVGRTGNICRAARELYVSQPAVSRSIQKLEENLGVLLFKRNSHGVTLTPEGTALFEKVQNAFSLIQDGEDQILRGKAGSIPRLRLGTSSTLCQYVLLSYLRPYISNHPQTRITISCQSTYQTLHLLDEEKIDLGLAARPRKLQGYYFHPLLHITDTFVATATYLKNQAELFPDESLFHTATFMMLDEENITRQSVNAQLKEHQLELTHILEVTSMDLVIRFAQIGLGIACVIRQFVEKELTAGTLVEVPMNFTFPEREIGFVCRQRDRENSMLQEFFTPSSP